jgi:uncharacterized protein
MQYFAAPVLEHYEQELIPQNFDKAYYPHGEVTLGTDSNVTLQTTSIDFLDLDGATLAIEPDTVSWSFFGRRETELVKQLQQPRSYQWLLQNWPQDGLESPDAFVSQLFRRGLLTIDNHTCTDPTIFQDSANVQEGHLVELLITEKCNLACSYCLAGANPKMPHMNSDMTRKTVDLAFAMQEAPNLTFEFSGGEPFLRFDLIKETTEYINQQAEKTGRKAYVCLQTNGTLLNPERVAWAKQNNVQIGLSLDGNPQSHNLSRPQVNGKESFSKILYGLDLLQEAGIEPGVLVVLNRSNVHSVQELVDFLVDNGIHGVKLNPVAFLGTARADWHDVGLSQEEITEYFQSFAHLIVEQNHSLIETNLRDMIRHIISKQRQSRCLRGHCGAGESFQTIAANGDIYPCGRSTQTPELVLGNVFDETRSLSAPAQENPFIQQIKTRRPKTLEGCSSCHYREMCQAGCSVQAFEKYRTVRHRTPECSFNKAMYPFLLRWLSFDPMAVDFFNRYHYFGEGTQEIEIVSKPFLLD